MPFQSHCFKFQFVVSSGIAPGLFRDLDRMPFEPLFCVSILVFLGIIARNGIKHSHEQDKIEIQVAEVVRDIKRRAEENPNAPPAQIYRAEVSKIGNKEDIISNLPQKNDLIRNINRIHNRNRPQNVNSLENLQILPPYDRTLNGELFLQYDSQTDDLLFSTHREIWVVCRVILCDGTFKTVPSMFFQLYSIHGVIQDYTFPLVYCISTRKTESFYRQLLVHLRSHTAEHNLTLQPQIILSHFEIAFMNAAAEIFPNAEVKGCLFHFTQSIWRRAVLRGLKGPYNNDIPEVKDTILSLLS